VPSIRVSPHPWERESSKFWSQVHLREMAATDVDFTFEDVVDKPSFPDEEVKTIAYWKKIDAFRESVRQSKGRPLYSFNDGPPFATGLPHYGHILAGTIKDIVVRFYRSQGYHVEPRWGWDCHGLPVEYEVDKKLNIKGKPDVMKMGIAKYNEECRSIVQRFVDQWEYMVERSGRWIEFEGDWKTMNLSFMESVWWVFKSLFDKKLIYRAFRVMPFSTACCTPLSNFEVALNYKEVSDPSTIVQLKVINNEDMKDTWLLVWTTTPWTLPSNCAACCNPEFTYLRVKNNESGVEWIVGEARFEWVCGCIKKDSKKDFTILKTYKGSELVGTQYKPLFDYFLDKFFMDKAFRVISDAYVTADSGTCMVHQAPAFGEDDNRVCLKFGVVERDGTGLVCPVDDMGKFTDGVTDFKGRYVKEADKDIKALLKKNGNLVYDGVVTHNYPHCYRSDTPLIYKANASWFVKVEERREDLIRTNNMTRWVPSFVREKRFHNWLSEARDWCISRNRYWGTPIPLWVSDDMEEVVCIGSAAELEQYTDGKPVVDIHRHFIDDIKIPSKMGKGMLHRIDEVLVCWFESGSMPYASRHYPFENKEEFEANFPAEFIGEGLDQTRGWFYSLHVLATLLFDKPAFNNLIVNGLVLAADGKKMSKRLKNYPDPKLVFESHGADAVRMYMTNSPVVRAEPLKFKEEGVKSVIKDVFLPWFNVYRFFVQEVRRYESNGTKFVPDPSGIKTSTNFMDKWVNAGLHGLIKFMKEEMLAYRLYTVVPRLTNFLEDLTNWYVRCNRDRMRGNNGPEEARLALCQLFEVLITMACMMAPIVPFITDMMYRNLARALPDGHAMKTLCVHWVVNAVNADPEALNPKITTAVQRLQSVVELGRTCRERKKVGLKTPLKSMKLLNKSAEFMKDIKELEVYLKDELNVVELILETDTSNVILEPTLNFRMLGKKLGKDMKKVQEALKSLSEADLKNFDNTGKITVCGYELCKNLEEPELSEMTVTPKVKDLTDPNFEANGDKESLVILDFTYDEELEMMATCRTISNTVQKLRKEAKLQQDDAVDMWATVLPGKKSTGKLAKVLAQKSEEVNRLLRRSLFDAKLLQGHEVVVQKGEEVEIDQDKLVITITTRSPFFNGEALKTLTGGDWVDLYLCAQELLQTFSAAKLAEAKGTPTKVSCDGKNFELKYGEHWALGPADAPWLKA